VIMSALARWWRERRPPPPPTTAVPNEVREASHALVNAAQRARWHIHQAELSLHPVEGLIRAMREELPEEEKDTEH
jgi:hypothetical protein